MNRQRRKNFCCSYCSKTFIDNAHLKDHEVKHSGEKPFVCEQCNKRFARSGSLRVHAKVHTGSNQEYVCPVTSCSRRYTSKSGFIYHQKKHNSELDDSINDIVPEDPQSIQENKEMRISSYNLDSQEKKVFPCPIPGCYKSFSSQNSLNFHTYRVHLGMDTNVCSKSRCIRLREAYLRQQLQIQKMKEKIKELEAMTSLLSRREKAEFQKEYRALHEGRGSLNSGTLENDSILVVPVQYLEEEKPYVCGVDGCKERFSTYSLLSYHAKHHPDHSIEEVLCNQLMIPAGGVYCPILGCEYGPQHKPLSSYFVLKRHYRRYHLHAVDLTQTLIGDSASPLPTLLNNLLSEGALVINQATILSDVTIDHSNVAIASQQCEQVVKTKCDEAHSLPEAEENPPDPNLIPHWGSALEAPSDAMGFL